MTARAAPFVLIVALAACATGDYYADRSGPEGARWGYEDERLPDGRYEVSVVLPGHASDAAAMAVWDRRAAELCGGAYEKNVFEARRATVLYSTYGGAPGGPQLRGYVTCAADGPAEAGPAPDAAPVTG